MPPAVLGGDNAMEVYRMQGTVLTIGEIVVEIMATTPGHGFREAIDLVGPFPSGAPAIFIDQVAKLGVSCAMVGAVGDDDFGRVNIDRLRRDGVDVSAITVHPDAVTGSAFVRYRPDGQRDFVFNIKHSANGRIGLTDAARVAIARATHLHVVGSSLSTPAIVETVMAAMAEIKARGGTVSFDPNVRKELLGDKALHAVLEKVMDASDLFLPSGDELYLFADKGDETAATSQILSRGVTAIVLKRGASGARYVDAKTDISAPAFAADEIDPTGAGDIFGATFVAGWLSGLAPADNLRRANAAGALAVGRKGPMEGTSTSDEIARFLADRTR
jgi:sugar/nucleoside kinase (ribokinase family)